MAQNDRDLAGEDLCQEVFIWDCEVANSIKVLPYWLLRTADASGCPGR